MDKQFKYMWTWYGGEELLFDLKHDPLEQHNLADLPEYNSIKEKLKGNMVENMKKTSPHLVEGNKPSAGERINSHRNISRFPGLNTTLFPRDSFH